MTQTPATQVTITPRPQRPQANPRTGRSITLNLDDLGDLTIRGFDGDTDTLNLSDVLDGLRVVEGDRATAVDILFERGHDASVMLDSDGNGSFETLAVTLGNYHGALGLDDVRVIQAAAA